MRLQVFKWGGKVPAAQRFRTELAFADHTSNTAPKVCWSLLSHQLSFFYAFSLQMSGGCFFTLGPPCPPTHLRPTSFLRLFELFWAVFIAADPCFVLQLKLFAAFLPDSGACRAERNALGFKLSTWVHGRAGKRIQSNKILKSHKPDFY